MKSDFSPEQIPLWGVFCLTFAMVLFAVWIGRFLGNRRRSLPDHEDASSLGTIVGSTLGLLAFMLAITFGMAADRFQIRKQLLLDEVNAIGTTYLRAGLLQEPHRSEVIKLLREYVDLRANLSKEKPAEQIKKIHEVISRSEAIQNQMWSHAVAMARKDRNSEIDSLFISSLNDVIDYHNKRITVARYSISTPIWVALYFITILSMLMVGYQIGLSGKSNVKVIFLLALTFSAVVFLILDLDRAAEGRIKVSQQPMLELQKMMQTQIQQADLGKQIWVLPGLQDVNEKEK